MPHGSNTNIKFLYSYGGKIIPRRRDGKLRYVGGYTRVVAVDRSITFAELMVKFGEVCGCSMSLRCKLPNEDLDLLISVTCDEDLATVIEEYDRVSSSTNQVMKIRALLFPIKSLKTISPPTSVVSSFNVSSSKPPPFSAATANWYAGWCYSPAVGYPVAVHKDVSRVMCAEAQAPRQCS